MSDNKETNEPIDKKLKKALEEKEQDDKGLLTTYRQLQAERKIDPELGPVPSMVDITKSSAFKPVEQDEEHRPKGKKPK